MRPEAGAQPLFLPQLPINLSPLLIAEGYHNSALFFLVTWPARALGLLLAVIGFWGGIMSVFTLNVVSLILCMALLMAGGWLWGKARRAVRKRVYMGTHSDWRFGTDGDRYADMYVTDGTDRYAIADVRAETSCRCQGRQQSFMGTGVNTPLANRLEGEAACELLAQAAKEQHVWTGPDNQGAS